MCVAVPARITWIGEKGSASVPARGDLGGGSVRDVDLVMVPDAEIGDYVIVHSGFAIDRVPRDQAEQTRRLLGLEP